MRAIVGVLDSFGLGAAPDAERFGDAGANTFGHIAKACAEGLPRKDGRTGPLDVPNMLALGLGKAAVQADDRVRVAEPCVVAGKYGFAAEMGRGKDTPSGHWEMMGLPVDYDWGFFPKTVPSFPAELTAAFIAETRVPGILGDCHASGTEIIEQLGMEHIRTGKPIVYTSADSVYQIAAHETHFGLERLYECCHIARRLVDKYNIGRVIARPFVGEKPGAFKRTGNRHDYAMPPHAPTLLDRYAATGRLTFGIGKISDIFAGKGITEYVKAFTNDEVFDAMLDLVRNGPEEAIIFANFVDFDTLYGHRRDIAGYAGALEAFDRRIPELRESLRDGDLAIFSADHGCDPTWPGTDHTREYVPILAFGPGVAPGPIGPRKTFADIGQSVAQHLGLPPLPVGTSFL
ncbi:MAG: phosphopentomutase [Proteobacteria bacterium]|nr:phosphopentomutase [Pseudomonadota bacterium]